MSAHLSSVVTVDWLIVELGGHLRAETVLRKIRAAEKAGLITPHRGGPKGARITGIPRDQALRMVAAERRKCVAPSASSYAQEAGI